MAGAGQGRLAGGLPMKINQMNRKLLIYIVLMSSAPSFAAPAAPDPLIAMAARFAPVEIRADVASLPAGERASLGKMIAAARILDSLFLAQVSPANGALLLELAADHSPGAKARLDYFLINKGPWSTLDHDSPFLKGVGPKPPQAGFYPADATKDEVERWFGSLNAAAREQATGFFTTIRRNPQGALQAVPYSLEYQSELGLAARYLHEAAALTKQPTLKSYLDGRADAFRSNDYYASDIAWMDLDATIEPTIGPYETYEDGWFNYKAAFESIIGVVDGAETAKLRRFSAELQGLEDRLPIEPGLRHAKLGSYSPIRLINVVYASGDADRGVQLAAFNLPNDERVVTAKGSKRVLMKNFQQAKFDRVLVPIAAIVLEPGDRAQVRFDSFFTHILMHELMHGLGPQTITVGGRSTSVRQELKEVSGEFEEAKADISGLWALQQLIDKGVLAKADEQSFYVTFLASMFRTLRFGPSDAHARGMALQLNYLLDAGAVTVGADGRCSVDWGRIKAAVLGLTHEIMTIQAAGDYVKARDWLAKMRVIRPPMQRLIERLNAVPVDIRPNFVTAATLAPG